MAAALLRVQFGSGWTTSILNSFGIYSTVCDEFTNIWKRKHDRDSARKINLKYKKQRLMTRYGQQTVKFSPDSSYGSNPSEPDISCDELKPLCKEYLGCLQVHSNDSIIELHHYASHCRWQVRRLTKLPSEQLVKVITHLVSRLYSSVGVSQPLHLEIL